MSTAVCIVICKEPAMRAPARGFWPAYSSRSAINPGISVSAIAISLRPHSAWDISATLQSVKFISFGLSTAFINLLLIQKQAPLLRYPHIEPRGLMTAAALLNMRELKFKVFLETFRCQLLASH